MRINCDMCGSEIKDGECTCGTWLPREMSQQNQILKALEEFHDMKRLTLTGDAPHLGCAVVLFRGDYNDCKTVEKFIHNLKGRPYYEE